MSNPNQSSNKLPREIYQRRRLAAFVVILVVVVGLLIAFTAFGGDNNDETAAPESTPVSEPENPEDEGASSEGSEEIESEEPSASEEADAHRDRENSGETESSEEARSSNIDPALADKDSCQLSDLAIRASSDATTYPNGVQPTFGMTVVNPTGADCEIDLDEESLRFEVYRISDNQRMWSDTDCYDSVQTGTYEFPAGEERSFDAVWSRLASERGGDCRDRSVVEPGAYFLHTVIGDNASEPYTFNLA